MKIDAKYKLKKYPAGLLVVASCNLRLTDLIENQYNLMKVISLKRETKLNFYLSCVFDQLLR